MHENAVRKIYMFGTTNTILMRAGGLREGAIEIRIDSYFISGVG